MTGRELARRAIRGALLLAGVAFMVIAFRETVDDLEGSVVPSATRLLVGTGLVTIGVALGGRAWAQLFDVPRPARRALGEAFWLSQLGKYVPGSVWQAAGLVGATRRWVGGRRAATAFVVFALLQVVAGLTVGAPTALFGDGVNPVARSLAWALPLSLVLAHRGWMTWLLARIPRGGDPSLAPGQAHILRSLALSGATMLASGTAFAVVLGGLGGDAPALEAAFVWPIAWAVGFVAIAVPAGVGVREAALVAILAPGHEAAAVIAASLYHRLATIAGEAILISATGARRRLFPADDSPA